MTYDESRQQIILYGGQSSVNIYPTDTWAWGGNDWEQLATIQEPPPQLSYGAKLVYFYKKSSGKFRLFNCSIYNIYPFIFIKNYHWIP